MVKFIVAGSKNCPACKRFIIDLKNNNISYTFCDIKDPEIEEKMDNIRNTSKKIFSKYISVPMFFCQFSEKELEKIFIMSDNTNIKNLFREVSIFSLDYDSFIKIEALVSRRGSLLDLNNISQELHIVAGVDETLLDFNSPNLKKNFISLASQTLFPIAIT